MKRLYWSSRNLPELPKVAPGCDMAHGALLSRELTGTGRSGDPMLRLWGPSIFSRVWMSTWVGWYSTLPSH